MSGPSARFAAIPRSGIREIFELALRVPDALHLEIGTPDFDTPPHVAEAAARAAADGFTRYTSAAGLPTLRELIAEKLRVRNAVPCTIENVVVSAGGCCALYATLAVLLDAGDEVLVPDPGWAAYAAIVQSVGGRLSRYPLVRERGFEPDLEALEAAITGRTKVLVLNSPGNPTGVVHRREELDSLLEIAARHDLWVLSDEAYEDIVFDDVQHVSPGAIGDPERVVSVFTFSKSYAMTGWRVGYAVAPTTIAPSIAQAQEPLVACASSVSQKAAEAALTGPQEIVGEMCAAYRRRRDAALELLDAQGLTYVRPRGAFYLMVSLPGDGRDSVAFAKRALAEAGVAVAPGSAFGPRGEGMVRVSLCVADDVLEAGLGRLAGVVDEALV